MATGSDEVIASARIFDAATGAEICRLDHEGRVGRSYSAQTGSRVATGSPSLYCGTQIWCTDHSQLTEQALGRLNRNLTQQEWRRYFGDEPYRKTRADLP